MMREWSQVARYLRRIANNDGITAENLIAQRQHRGTESAGASTLSDEAVDAWSRFCKGKSLSDADKYQLEAVVVPNGLRPVFDIKNDSFPDLPDPWNELSKHRAYINQCICSIGRVNVPGHAKLDYAGTAFIVGHNLLLTNRHVADQFCQGSGETLVFTPGISPSIDMKQEVGNNTSITIKITKPLEILSDWDVALLQMSEMPPESEPLRLAGAPPGITDGRLATIIGYPALDTRGSTEELLQQMQIFRAVFDKKRLQPGRLMGFRDTLSFGRTVRALGHDCSTLGGNSGSAVVDVQGEIIVGLHFGGEYLVANYAVPTWELAANQRLRNNGVLFV